MKLGLLATDAAVLSSIGRMLSERGDAGEALRPRERLAADLNGNRGWSHLSTLLVGAAIGVGVGILFAPVTGEQARNTIRDTAIDVKDKVIQISGWAANRRSTGTYAD
ncbi:MAG TPA: YtxH domain-containing protein [Candidatus Sulfotelmatobacter sp.]|nr:YtxH domain-containing protein [Candidatus Sulfotelmatobacter sp.]